MLQFLGQDSQICLALTLAVISAAVPGYGGHTQARTVKGLCVCVCVTFPFEKQPSVGYGPISSTKNILFFASYGRQQDGRWLLFFLPLELQTNSYGHAGLNEWRGLYLTLYCGHAA